MAKKVTSWWCVCKACTAYLTALTWIHEHNPGALPRGISHTGCLGYLHKFVLWTPVLVTVLSTWARHSQFESKTQKYKKKTFSCLASKLHITGSQLFTCLVTASKQELGYKAVPLQGLFWAFASHRHETFHSYYHLEIFSHVMDDSNCSFELQSL